MMLTRPFAALLLCSLLIPLPAAAPLAPGAPVTFKLNASRERDLRGSPTLIIPTVYVELAVAGKVSATKQGGALASLGGGGSNTVKAKAQWAVDGLDKAFAQSIARKVQEDLVAKLRAAGYTVKTYEDIKGLDAVKAAKRQALDAAWGLPLIKSQAIMNSVAVVAAPSDEQYFISGMAWGLFNQFVRGTKSTLGEGTILIPTITIAAPQAWVETGGGYKRISAQANVAPGMNLTIARADFMSDRGSGGTLMTTEQIINLNEKVGELTTRDTTPASANALSSALSALSGAGSISTKSGHYLLTIDRAAYEAAVLRGAVAFNSEIAKLAAKK
jgi:hypothetical protein